MPLYCSPELLMTLQCIYCGQIESTYTHAIAACSVHIYCRSLSIMVVHRTSNALVPASIRNQFAVCSRRQKNRANEICIFNAHFGKIYMKQNASAFPKQSLARACCLVRKQFFCHWNINLLQKKQNQFVAYYTSHLRLKGVNGNRIIQCEKE